MTEPMTEQLKATIEVNIAPRQGAVGAWDVEAIDEDGSIEQAIFAGPNAESRARRYADLQYTSAPVQDDDAEWLRNNAADICYGGIPLRAGARAEVKNRLLAIAARLSTDTALIELLEEARPYVDECFGDLDRSLSSRIDKALASRGGDNGGEAGI